MPGASARSTRPASAVGTSASTGRVGRRARAPTRSSSARNADGIGGWPPCTATATAENPKSAFSQSVGVGSGDVAGKDGGHGGDERVPRLGERGEREHGQQHEREERHVEAVGRRRRSRATTPSSAPAIAGEERRDAEHDHLGDVGGQPHRGHRPSTSPTCRCSIRPRRLRSITATAAPRDHDRGEDDVVEGLRAVGEAGPRHHPSLGEGGEHPPLRVQQLLDEDPEPERGQREEEPRQADRRDGHERADRHGDEAGDEQRQQPGHAVVDVELRERDGADGREGGVAQRHLSRRAHQQPERQQDHRGAQPGGEERQLGRRPSAARARAAPSTTTARPRRTRAGDRYWIGGRASTVVAGTSRRPGRHEQRDEQDHERQGVGEARRATTRSGRTSSTRRRPRR